MNSLLVLLLAGVTLIVISVKRTYSHIPTKQLRYLARQGDPVAKLLHRAASYGHSLNLLLWTIIGLSGALLFIVLATTAPLWFAVTGISVLIWISLVWIPSGQVSNSSKWLAARLAPFFAWLLNYLHPLLHALARLGRRLYPIRVHTGLYDKQDLIDLLTRQSHQLDNRINAIELSIAVHALTVADRKVEDILTPRRVVKAVSIEETVGPVLMSELHDSGLSRFPVYSGKKDNVVGTLYLRDLVNAEGAGSVRQLMHTEVRYIHEDQSALEALQAMIKTKHHLFIVVNSFEEYVGVVTLEDVVEEVIGQQIVDEFDQYEDMRAVAASQAKKDHKEHQTDTEAPDTIEA